MSNFLSQMAELSRGRVLALQQEFTEDELYRLAHEAPPPTCLTLGDEPFDIIAEFKPASPSSGVLISDGADTVRSLVERIGTYSLGGAAAISVLTEPHRFRGSLALLDTAVDCSPIPVMRKDFLVHPMQVAEARVHGAAGVLVIARMLNDETLSAMCRIATDLGLFVLLEAFDERDLERSANVFHLLPEPRLIGLNCRDLSTLNVKFDRLLSLVDAFPPGVVRVAESGVETSDDVRRLSEAGYRLALVGSALMRDGDPTVMITEMLAAGRQG